MKELIEKLYKEDMLWFFLANLISDSALNNEHDCESTLYIIDSFNECLGDADLVVNTQTKEKLNDLLKQSKEVVVKEYARFKLN